MQIGILIGFILGRIYNLKVVGTPYSFATQKKHFYFSKTARFVESYFYKRIEKVVFETEENKKKAKELRNLILPNSMVINTGIPAPEKAFANNPVSSRIHFFYVGRIVKIKAIDKLILSILWLNDSLREKIKIDIIGEGELVGPLRALVEEKKLTKVVKIHGFINDATKFYKNSDIFILPSDQEGLSISLLEAMSYGKACIVNNFGVPFTNKELFIMDNNEPETIANTIRYFLDHKELIYSFGKNARKRIKKDFSVQSFSDKYSNLYSQLTVE